MAKATTRVQLEMPDPSYERLNALRQRTEASSNAEVIRRALQLYEAVVDEHDKGVEIAFRKEEDGEIIYRPLFC